MKTEDLVSLIRNIGIAAHIDAGKTTITERILYYTGKNYKIGEVHEGTTVTDYMEQERERGITITSASVTCDWLVSNINYVINLIDTPGHVDFTMEVERSMRVLDGAVIAFDGVAGVEPQSETVWNQANKYDVPKICFVNKLDRIGANYFKCLDMIRERLSRDSISIVLPIGEESNFCGIIDLLSMKEIKWSSSDLGINFEVSEIREEFKEKSIKYRYNIIEKCSEYDDTIAEKFLYNLYINEDELIKSIRLGLLNNKFIPVLCGSALKNKCIQFLLDKIVQFLPSPIDKRKIKVYDSNNELKLIDKNFEYPFIAIAFKIINDKYGLLVFIRVYSGFIKKGDSILNSKTKKKSRIGRIVRMFADKKNEIEIVNTGEIAAIIGLEAKTGDTLCSTDIEISLESLNIPEAVVDIAVEPKNKIDQEKLILALNKLSDEDPSLRIKLNNESSQTIISGMGELHLEIIIDRILREYGVSTKIGKPQVAYRETITKNVIQEGKYIKQSGGRGQYGHVVIKMEPNERGKGFLFVNKIVGGIIPKEYITHIKKGIEEALTGGIVAGFQAVDITVTLFDGSFHDVDSSEMAFKIAGSIAFKEGGKKADPIILEPIMKVEIIVPENFLGDVVGDVNSRRGKIISINDKTGIKIVNANIPLSNLFGYANDLRSKTQGRANYSMEFNHYEIVPSNISQELIKK